MRSEEAVLEAVARAKRVYLSCPSHFRVVAEDYVDEATNELIAQTPPALPEFLRPQAPPPPVTSSVSAIPDPTKERQFRPQSTGLSPRRSVLSRLLRVILF